MDHQALTILDFNKTNAPSSLAEADAFFLKHTYVCGYQPSSLDTEYFHTFSTPPPAQYKCLTRWYNHITSYTSYEQSKWAKLTKSAAGVKRKQADDSAANMPVEKQGKHKEASHPTESDDEDFDPFAEPTEEETQKAKEMADIRAKEKAAAAKKKPEVIAKSQIILHVKPGSIDVNLDEMEKKIKELKIEGLTWSVTTKKLPIAYGLFQLQIGCTIIDDLVATDDVIDAIECIGCTEERKAKKLARKESGDDEDDYDEEAENDFVSSAQIVSFNKL